jgi:hypothetical protein
MQVSAWSNGSRPCGIRVGIPNRDQSFERSWETIEVNIDGQFHQFPLTEGFWRNCPEFRDSGDSIIHDWLHRHGNDEWPKGDPPKFKLTKIGGNRFQLELK